MHLCQHCLARGIVRTAKQVDHKVRLADGGSNDLDNLQSLCTDCHKAKTIQENGGRTPRAVGLDGYPVP